MDERRAALADEQAFKEHPLAPIEDEQEERARLRRLKEEDPIAVQDILNTSAALVDAAKRHDLKDAKRIVQDAIRGEFLQFQVFQAFMLALQTPDLEMARLFVGWGVPLDHPQYAESQHILAEAVNRTNFSDATRIMELLHKGNDLGARLDVDMPRRVDSFTALCIGCKQACLPLVFKLLEMRAQSNTITKTDETPLSLALSGATKDENDEQREARPIIAAMLREAGGKPDAKAALQAMLAPRKPVVSAQPRAGGYATSFHA